MGFWQKIKDSFRRFMSGRTGADELGLAMLITGLILSLIASFTGIAILSLLGTALYIWTVFRMFSRNTSKRYEENQKFVNARTNLKNNFRQFRVRIKNSKQYKYFKCPQCHSRLRLPRKVGEVTVTCGKCKHAFKKKA